MPRSGSSMVAGLFAKHGVWFGSDVDASIWNPHGSFESKPIKALLRRHFNAVRSLLDIPAEVPDSTERFLDELEHVLHEDGYVGGPWFFKGSCFYHRVFAPLQPVYVTIRRAHESIIRSFRRSRHVHNAVVVPAVEAHARILDQLEAVGAHRVDSEALIDGDYEQVKNVFRACGVTLNESIARRWISPSLWHFRPDDHVPA